MLLSFPSFYYACPYLRIVPPMPKKLHERLSNTTGTGMEQGMWYLASMLMVKSPLMEEGTGGSRSNP